VWKKNLDRIRTQTLYRKFKDKYLEDKIQKNGIRWYGASLRLYKYRIQKKKALNTRFKGRPRTRWEQHVSKGVAQNEGRIRDITKASLDVTIYQFIFRCIYLKFSLFLS
jgi:hypothetical protein